MWKASVGVNQQANQAGDDDDDWETDPDYVNDMTEEQQRWGGKRDAGAIESVSNE